MRRIILSVIGLLWGCAIVAHGILVGFGDTGGSYRAGQIVAYLAGWAMAAAGISGLIRRRHREWFEW